MSEIPKPGKPVRGSKSGKPIMALFDLLGRSWALGIVWQLSQRPMTFREIQESCEGVSPTVLNKRLKELTSSGLIERGANGYQLTNMGTELFQLLQPFGAWSTRWAANLPPE
jgi:DNA-binding HxlR family transcriptional regulator